MLGPWTLELGADGFALGVLEPGAQGSELGALRALPLPEGRCGREWEDGETEKSAEDVIGSHVIMIVLRPECQPYSDMKPAR